ncbi:MAG: chemotaxis protein CheW [Clostridia bacterium]|nr:chemotaxis protein CheW [Clostridia bacterium]
MKDNFSEDPGQQQEDTQKGKFLTFRLGSESYAMQISYVKEIIGIQPITEVPEMPEYIRGIINLRGKIIPVMDVRLRFKKPFKDYNDRTCVIIVDIREISIGLVVDSVSEVMFIPETEIVEPPEVGRGSSRYIKAVGKVGNEVKLILDCYRLINEDEAKCMEDIKNGGFDQ